MAKLLLILIIIYALQNNAKHPYYAYVIIYYVLTFSGKTFIVILISPVKQFLSFQKYSFIDLVQHTHTHKYNACNGVFWPIMIYVPPENVPANAIRHRQGDAASQHIEVCAGCNIFANACFQSPIDSKSARDQIMGRCQKIDKLLPELILTKIYDIIFLRM